MARKPRSEEGVRLTLWGGPELPLGEQPRSPVCSPGRPALQCCRSVLTGATRPHLCHSVALSSSPSSLLPPPPSPHPRAAAPLLAHGTQASSSQHQYCLTALILSFADVEDKKHPEEQLERGNFPFYSWRL